MYWDLKYGYFSVSSFIIIIIIIILYYYPITISIQSLSDIFLFQEENKIHQSGHVCQRGSSLDVPLCMRDDIVTSLTPGVSSSVLYVLHSQIPQSQIVGKHVDVGKQSGSEGIRLWR